MTGSLPARAGNRPPVPGGRVAAEPHDRPERQRGQDPHHERRDQHQPEQPMPPCPRRQPNRVHQREFMPRPHGSRDMPVFAV